MDEDFDNLMDEALENIGDMVMAAHDGNIPVRVYLSELWRCSWLDIEDKLASHNEDWYVTGVLRHVDLMMDSWLYRNTMTKIKLEVCLQCLNDISDVDNVAKNAVREAIRAQEIAIQAYQLVISGIKSN